MEKQSRKELLQAYKERTILGGVYAIENTATGRVLLLWDRDLQGSRNSFQFSQMTDSPPSSKLQRDWRTYGKEAFTFTVLEELEKKAEQTDLEFRGDLETLLALCRERYLEEGLY